MSHDSTPLLCRCGCGLPLKRQNPSGMLPGHNRRVVDAEQTFWSKVDKDGPIPTHRPELGPCWQWTGAIVKDGYGSFGAHKRTERAHRYSWELHIGPIPKGLWVLHACDNPACVRPDHLFLGTARDNAVDMYRKKRDGFSTGRLRTSPHVGEANNLSKLTIADVRAIRVRLASGETITAVAKSLGLSRNCVSSIRSGRTWKHAA